MKIHLIDTTVFCNVLNVYGLADNREETIEELNRINDNRDNERIILPFATIIETGNHISQIPDGNLRYNTAKLFCEAIKRTVDGSAPWAYYGSQLTEDDLIAICDGFPEAVKSKVGIGDLSIIRTYEKYRDETPGIGEIRIWTYDSDLEPYHEKIDMNKNKRRNGL